MATRITVEDAAEAFLVRSKNRSIAPNTLAKYRTFTDQRLAYGADRGRACIDQLTVSDMDRISASWRDGTLAKAKSLSV